MRNLGMILLAIYLILVGVKAVVGFTVPHDHMLLGVLAIVAGVLLILKK